MDADPVRRALTGLALGGLRYASVTGSTNQDAAEWADGRAGPPAADLSLVIADEQTAGRGRQGRKWHTPPGVALAFSLALRPAGLYAAAPGLAALDLPSLLGRLTALGGLAVCQALRADYDLPAALKWPNDVLIERRKVCGVLAEAHWNGAELAAVILGIGVNVTPAALPPAEELIYPATSVESVLGRAVDRLALLRQIMIHLLAWRTRLAAPEFWQTWDDWLAFKGERVWVAEGAPLDAPHPPGDATESLGDFGRLRSRPKSPTEFSGVARLLGLNPDGSLRLQGADGEPFTLRTGELHIRPQDWL